MSDYQDIWSHDEGSHSALSEEQLLAYLEGRLNDEERHTVEAMLSEESMESDALEGLRGLSPGEMKKMKHRLHASLQRSLHKRRRGRRGIGEQRWIWIAIGIILLLTILCYAVMCFMKHPLK